ncbi:MAG: flavodoxin domain-containing protein [Bdellovibrionota bacterium]
MNKVAIIYATKHGQTEKIAQFLANRIKERSIGVQIINAGSRPALLESDVDAILYGGPVYAGRFPKSLVSWIRRHHLWLATLPSGFFAVSLNAADNRPEAKAADSELLQSFMRQSGIVPDYVGSFQGALHYTNYNWLIRMLMKQLSAKAGGDTDTSRNFEYTNWAIVDAFLDAFVNRKDTTGYSTAKRFSELEQISKMKVFEQSWHKSIVVHAQPGIVYSSFKNLPVGEARLARLLSLARTLGRSQQNTAKETFSESAGRFGNITVHETPGKQISSGLIGQFWQLDFGIVRIKPEEFFRFARPGYTKVLTDVRFEPISGTSSTTLHVEMRIHSTDAEARRRFYLYWTLLSPGIGLYMGSLLRAVKSFAEMNAKHTKAPPAQMQKSA